MTLMNSPSILEWILMGVGATTLIIYIIISILKTKKKKKEFDEKKDRDYE